MKNVDPTDPYLLEVVNCALAFAAEKEKLLHGQTASIDEATDMLRISIQRAIKAWQRRTPRSRSTVQSRAG